MRKESELKDHISFVYGGHLHGMRFLEGQKRSSGVSVKQEAYKTRL